MSDIPKKTGVIFLLIAIFLAIIVVGILNYTKTLKVDEVESKESTSSGEITLIVREPPKIKDESTGSVSLVVQQVGKK